ncbi:MAG: YicC/YloC family endoribonuclease [Candidatus Omnitrophota bacterium]
MVRSMTGFGRAELKTAFGIIAVEIRSFNHKFFEISQRLPVDFLDFEDKIKEHVQEKIKRGRLNLTLTFTNTAGRDAYTAKKIIVNKKLASEYCRSLTGLKRHLGMQEEISLAQILSLPGVMTLKESQVHIHRLWPVVKRVIDKAVCGLIVMREKEGRHLYRDVVTHLRMIEKSLMKIIKFQPEAITRFKQRLLLRIKELGSKNLLDQERLVSEIAVFVRNSDITEELTRLKSHIANLGKILIREDELGRKLDFIAQELNREINTIGSKAESFDISKEAIEIKSCIDKIREQVQNIE